MVKLRLSVNPGPSDIFIWVRIVGVEPEKFQSTAKNKFY